MTLSGDAALVVLVANAAACLSFPGAFPRIRKFFKKSIASQIAFATLCVPFALKREGQQIRKPITDLHSGDGNDGLPAPLESFDFYAS